MNPQMFFYQYKTYINKAIAKHFKVDKIKMPKFKTFITKQAIDNQFLVIAYYDPINNIIGINNDMWDIATEYEKFNAVTHELVHAYQRKYQLCNIDPTDVEYTMRSQELHCEEHTSQILIEMGIEASYSILSLF